MYVSQEDKNCLGKVMNKVNNLDVRNLREKY